MWVGRRRDWGERVRGGWCVRGGRRERERGGYRVVKLMKHQKNVGGITLSFTSPDFFSIFFYEVFAKQKKRKYCRYYY
jgi:hypothetical protein